MKMRQATGLTLVAQASQAKVPPNPQAQADAIAKTKRQKAFVKAIVALFAEGAVGYGLMIGIRAALLTLGVTPEIANWLAQLTSTHTTFPDLGLGGVGPMQKMEEKQALAWRAIYILAASERLQEAIDLAHAEQVELGYFARHVAAEERRVRAAALVDVTARLLGDRTEEQEDNKVPLLGWRAVLDDKTTPECRWASGKNFRADRIPVIGIPGGVHPRCRCTSGPAIKGAPLIPSV